MKEIVAVPKEGEVGAPVLRDPPGAGSQSRRLYRWTKPHNGTEADRSPVQTSTRTRWAA
jgi:hypothetical protein